MLISYVFCVHFQADAEKGVTYENIYGPFQEMEDPSLTLTPSASVCLIHVENHYDQHIRFNFGYLRINVFHNLFDIFYSFFELFIN